MTEGILNMSDKTNYKGEIISGIRELRKPEYGTGEFDSDMNPIPNWNLVIDGDGHGFDKHHKEPNGDYIMKVVLPRHTRLVRYGTEAGSYTAPLGTKYEELSLPYKKESVYYHEYEVIARAITVFAVRRGCFVDRGRAAPGFDYPGGALQYFHPFTMIESKRRRLLREII